MTMNKKIEIYIHIPFCVKKCDYCDFLSAPCDDETKKKYVDALCREIEWAKDCLKEYQVDTIFIGGGTPSILEGKYIGRILNAVYDSAKVSDKAEVTIECNPGTLTIEKLENYKEVGINRISIGLQSANDEELKSIGRIHNFAEFKESYKLAREAGFENINVDLMSALPGQTVESYKETLNKVICLNPEHISAYSLIVEDETPLKERVENGLVELPKEDDEREMYYMTKDILEKAGYKRYEISNYAKDGFECRHNVGYWKRTEYLGFGIGAASLFRAKRFYNTSDINRYINMLERDVMNAAEVWESINENEETLTKNDEMEEFMFLGLRMMDGISADDFKESFGKDIKTVYGEVLEKLESQGLLVTEQEKIKLSERGIDISNQVLANFLL